MANREKNLQNNPKSKPPVCRSSQLLGVDGVRKGHGVWLKRYNYGGEVMAELKQALGEQLLGASSLAVRADTYVGIRESGLWNAKVLEVRYRASEGDTEDTSQLPHLRVLGKIVTLPE